MGNAWAAGHDAVAEPSFFANPETWVAVAFVLFVVLLGKLLWGKITALLDKRSADIAKAIRDAETLRAEALKGKEDAERTLAQATAEAEGIVTQAREEVARMQARAVQNLDTAMVLREQQALDRIAQSEAAAVKQVRDTAVDVALSATRSLLREQVGTAGTQSHIEQAITELPKRLH
jgi:F-type H+-transporting ATPase subunit b